MIGSAKKTYYAAPQQEIAQYESQKIHRFSVEKLSGAENKYGKYL